MSKVCGILLVVCIALFFVNAYIINAGLPYEINKQRANLDIALTVNNINSKILYIENVLIELEPYHGNTGVLFPDDRTDIDVIKQIMKSTLVDVKNQIGVKEKSQYVFLPHNELNVYLNTEIQSVSNYLGNYVISYGYNPYHNPIAFILTFFGLTLFVLGFWALTKTDCWD